jgi:hypothetical protein
MPNVTREGRISLGLVEGECLICGKCERRITGVAYITVDGIDTQDFIVLCSTCLDELAGPEFEAQEGEGK